MADPKVSVLCLTYNQKEYIKQTLEGFISQKTNFEYEVLINDDASNDGTAQIIKEYSIKYPEIIKPVFHSQNQYSKGIRGLLIRNLLPHAKGQYVALCDGDDYFCDIGKLQVQTDFMDANPDFALCFHPVRVIYENNESEEYVYPSVSGSNTQFTLKKLLKRNFIQTNSVMYRRRKYENLPVDIIPGDWYLHLYHAQFGTIGFIDRIMSVYRRHPAGLWWQAEHDYNKFLDKHGMMHLAMFLEALKLFRKNRVYKNIILGKIFYIKAECEYINKGKDSVLYHYEPLSSEIIKDLTEYENSISRYFKISSYRLANRFLIKMRLILRNYCLN
jgi:glycosyltransferase involved in cell wall biosynthesis